MRLRMNRLLLPAFSLALCAGFPAGDVATAQTLSQTRQAELTVLVRQDCGSCHGMTLKGGLGKALLPDDLKDKTVSDLTETILDGTPGTPMPGWRGLLTVDDARWIAEHLKAGAIKRGNKQ